MSFLILSLFLIGCGSRPFPTKYVHVVDVKNGVCAEKEIIDQESLTFKHIRDLPLIECDGDVAIRKEDFQEVKDWIKWAQGKAKQCETVLNAK